MASSTRQPRLAIIAFTAFTLAPACSDSGTADENSNACLWGVDELLAEVGASPAERRDCGSFNSAQTKEIAKAQTCFDDAVDRGAAVQATVNRCIDCSIPSTYVATEAGELFRVELEEDLLGDDSRVATVESCKAIALDGQGELSCTGSQLLYRCEEPLASN